MAKIGLHRGPTVPDTGTTPSASPADSSPPKQEAQPESIRQTPLTETGKTRQKLDGQLSGLLRRVSIEESSPEIGSHRAKGGGTTTPGLVGTTKTMSARNAPANTVIDAGLSRSVDLQYDGAFVGADPKAYSSEGAAGQAWSSKTDWTALQGVKPNNGRPCAGKCLYVNGMNCALSSQVKSLQQIANATGHEVIGIHNATEGFVKDVGQCITDKMNIGNNGAHKTLTETIYNHIKTKPDEPLNIVAHSQGGIITSRALRDVKNRLRLEDGMSSQQATHAMKNIRIQTAGAAAVRYTDGPQYLHHVNTRDPVPQFFAQTIAPLTDQYKHGPVHRFTNPSSMHGMDSTYVPQLVPFQNLSRAQKMVL